MLIPYFALSLIASFSFGVSDYIGGKLVRREWSPAFLVFWAQLFQAMVVAGIVVGLNLSIDNRALMWGSVAGVASAFAMMLFYWGIAHGPAGVVAPIVTASTATPVVLSVLTGDVSDPAVIFAVVVVWCGLLVMVRSGAAPTPDTSHAKGSRIPVYIWAALLAHAFVAVSILSLNAGVSNPFPSGNANFSTLLGLEAAVVPTVLVYVLVTRKAGDLTAPLRTRKLQGAGYVGLVALIGLNAGGDLAVISAFSVGPLGIVAVMASLDPLVTMALAWAIDGERLTERQKVAATMILGGALSLAALG